MTLVLTNEDVEALLTPRACIEPLEQAYREFGLGQAANRARSHSYFPVESRAHPRFHYRFKSQEGGSVSAGVWALRIASDMAGRRHCWHRPDVMGTPNSRSHHPGSVKTGTLFS